MTLTRDLDVDRLELSAADIERLARLVVDRVSKRLAAEIEHRRDDAVADDLDETASVDPHIDALPLERDRVEQELLAGAWVTDEITRIDQTRLRAGSLVLSRPAAQALRLRVLADLFGMGPLHPWWDDVDVEQIDVNSHRQTWVTWIDGTKRDIGQLWPSASELTKYQQRLALTMGTGEGRLDTSSPDLTLQAPDGSRVTMVLGGPTNHGVSTHPRLSIRRFVIRRVGLDALADRGMFPAEMTGFLEAIVRAGCSILISGSPSAGKTTFLIELSSMISPSERLVTVEKGVLELRFEDDPDRHHDVVALYTRQGNTDGAGEVGERHLLEVGRRLNPDRMYLSELTSNEAVDMLDAASMCKQGSMATIHARDPESALPRLAYYIGKADATLPEYAMWSLIAETLDFVIHIDLVRNASDLARPPVRRVTSVIEIGGLGEYGGVRSTELWAIDDTGALRRTSAALSERHVRRLRLAGFDPRQFPPAVQS